MKYILVITLLFAQPKYFDPDGFYFPSTKLAIGGISIKHINISTLEYDNNGKLDYENPKFIEPEIRIELTKSNKRLLTKEVVVNRDTIYFRINISQGKTLQFSGKFIDKRGQYWNQTDIDPDKTIILEGTFTYFENEIKKETKKVKFTYWQGD